MIKHEKTGGRTISLFIPFDLAGKQYDSITFGPLKLGHVILWNEGHWKGMIEFMAALAEVDISVLRELRYPDADRVTETFMAMMTPEIRNDVEVGRVPQKPMDEADLQKAMAAVTATNGSGDGIPVGPGVPMPPEMTPGFDLGEEP